MKRGPKNTKIGKQASTKLTSNELEKEALEFLEKRKPTSKPKPLTDRVYLMGQVLNALLINSGSRPPDIEEIKRQASSIADDMLRD